MPHKTDIEWTDYSSNPLRALAGGRRGHACVKISPGCANCYSGTMNNRFGTQRDYTKANIGTVEHFLDAKEMNHILTFRPKGPFKNGSTRPRVFMFDMTDVFGNWVSDETLDKLFAVFALRPDVDFQVLTKRADRMRTYITGAKDCVDAAILDWHTRQEPTGYKISNKLPVHPLAVAQNVRFREWWPLPNVWLGVSAENQKYADERVKHLVHTPAAVRFVSAEPLLGSIDFRKLNNGGGETYDALTATVTTHRGDSFRTSDTRPLDAIITGGESGTGARACNVEDIRFIGRQCLDAGCCWFNKQLGSSVVRHVKKTAAQMLFPQGVPAGAIVEGSFESYMTLPLNHPKGGAMNEWPADLRVRQMPGVAK
jgi:protein gp37